MRELLALINKEKRIKWLAVMITKELCEMLTEFTTA